MNTTHCPYCRNKFQPPTSENLHREWELIYCGTCHQRSKWDNKLGWVTIGSIDTIKKRAHTAQVDADGTPTSIPFNTYYCPYCNSHIIPNVATTDPLSDLNIQYICKTCGMCAKWTQEYGWVKAYRYRAGSPEGEQRPERKREQEQEPFRFVNPNTNIHERTKTFMRYHNITPAVLADILQQLQSNTPTWDPEEDNPFRILPVDGYMIVLNEKLIYLTSKLRDAELQIEITEKFGTCHWFYVDKGPIMNAGVVK